MVRNTALGIILHLLFFAVAPGQQQGWAVSVVARAMVTTSSKLFLNPDATSPELRTEHTPLNSVYGGGIDFRLKFPEDHFFFTLSVEYISTTREETRLDASISPPRRVPVDEGYLLIPVEIGAHLFIPLGSETWKVSMGGGIGAYYGERIYRVAEVPAEPRGNRFAFGIHVGTQTEYRLLNRLSVAAALKFRDPEINAVNRFETVSTVYRNNVIVFPKGDMKSRINVDGMTVSLGLVVDLL